MFYWHLIQIKWTIGAKVKRKKMQFKVKNKTTKLSLPHSRAKAWLYPEKCSYYGDIFKQRLLLIIVPSSQIQNKSNSSIILEMVDNNQMQFVVYDIVNKLFNRVLNGPKRLREMKRTQVTGSVEIQMCQFCFMIPNQALTNHELLCDESAAHLSLHH